VKHPKLVPTKTSPPAAGKKEEGKPTASPERLLLAAMGMEAEFTLVVDGRQTRPEWIFGDPRAFLGPDLMHRTGRSYHLATGGAVYFDTGVIEVATPAMEIERGCAARCGRSLWEGILEIRTALDRWERRTGHQARLTGFSAHYNVSFELPRSQQSGGRTVDNLAALLVHLLPVPVMLLAANRKSTGVGVRPRGDRIEITVDFTPSAALMIAAGTFIVGVVREAMRWRSYAMAELHRRGIPRIEGFHPMPHTSRKGLLAHASSFPRDPFAADVDRDLYRLSDGREKTLREVAGAITRHFWRPIRRISDPFTFRLIGSVMAGRAPSLLDLRDRPEEYEDVGRLCRWDNLFPDRALSRSRYEQVLIRAIAGRRLRMGGRWYRPVGMRGWSAVVFRPEGSPGTRTLPIDELVGRLGDWES
jgi:hypothetical protein